MYILQRRTAFDSKLEIPARRHFLHPFRQRHRFRAKRESPGSRSPERCGKFLLAYADRSHIDQQGSKKVYPANPLPAGERFSLRSMRSQFTSYEQLPITLTADHVAAALGISRANAYILLRSDGFPTLHIGKRMVVPKDRFLQWITDSVNG